MNCIELLKAYRELIDAQVGSIAIGVKAALTREIDESRRRDETASRRERRPVRITKKVEVEAMAFLASYGGAKFCHMKERRWLSQAHQGLDTTTKRYSQLTFRQL